MDYPKVFIIGSGRSGTTWVQTVFMKHPKTVNTGFESMLFDNIIEFIRGKKDFNKYCWHILEGYDHYVENTKMKKMITRNELCSYIQKCYNMTLDSQSKSITLIKLIVDNYYYNNGGDNYKVFIEKTPHNIFYVDEIMQIFPKAKIICMIRDGRDVCVSLEQLSKKGKDWVPIKRVDQINYWKLQMREFFKIISNNEYNKRIMVVKYEDLLKNKYANIFRMFDFANIDKSDEIINNIIELDTPVSVPYKARSGTWVDDFSNEDIRLFKRIAGKIMVRLGYKV